MKQYFDDVEVVEDNLTFKEVLDKIVCMDIDIKDRRDIWKTLCNEIYNDFLKYS